MTCLIHVHISLVFLTILSTVYGARRVSLNSVILRNCSMLKLTFPIMFFQQVLPFQTLHAPLYLDIWQALHSLVDGHCLYICQVPVVIVLCLGLHERVLWGNICWRHLLYADLSQFKCVPYWYIAWDYVDQMHRKWRMVCHANPCFPMIRMHASFLELDFMYTTPHYR